MNKPKIRKLLRKQYGDICPKCKRKMSFENYFSCIASYATIEHVVPRILGGSDELSNLILLCFSCNSGHGIDSKAVKRA